MHLGIWTACAPAARYAGDVGIGQVDAVPAHQPLVEQADLLQNLGGGLAGALTYSVHLNLALGEVRADGQRVFRGQRRHLPKQIVGASVHRMRRQVDPHARMVLPGLVQRHGAGQRSSADRHLVAPLALRDGREVHVMDAPARTQAEPEFGHGGRSHIGMDKMIAQDSRSK